MVITEEEVLEIYDNLDASDIAAIIKRDVETVTRIRDAIIKIGERSNKLSLRKKTKKLKQYEQLITIYNSEAKNRPL